MLLNRGAQKLENSMQDQYELFNENTPELDLIVEPIKLELVDVMPVPVIQRRGKLPTHFLGQPVPEIIVAAGEPGMMRFLEFFTAKIRNKNTRMAYAQAIGRFLRWCDERRLQLEDLNPIIVAGYIEVHPDAPPTVKQHLAAIRRFFDYLVLGHIIVSNPADAVQGPKHVVKRGKTPVLSQKQARKLLDSIETDTIAGLRDRAILGVMVYSFARVSAVVGMNARDYYQNGKKWWFRLHEKSGKFPEVPAHHNAEAYMDAYLQAAGIDRTDKASPLFRTFRGKRTDRLTENRMNRVDVFRMIRKRALKAGLNAEASCHTFRATGITAYLKSGGTLENAQAIAAHESPRTTKLYDRTRDEITLDEVEKIQI